MSALKSPRSIQAFKRDTDDLLRTWVKNYDSTDDNTLGEISDFNWLWPIFEAKALMMVDQSQLEIGGIKKLSEMLDCNFDQSSTSAIAFDHFRHRYSLAQTANEDLNDLCKSDNGAYRDLIRKSILQDKPREEKLAGLLTIVYRLRNNLFHGSKGNTGFHNQLSNFKYANSLLREWIDKL